MTRVMLNKCIMWFQIYTALSLPPLLEHKTEEHSRA